MPEQQNVQQYIAATATKYPHFEGVAFPSDGCRLDIEKSMLTLSKTCSTMIGLVMDTTSPTSSSCTGWKNLLLQSMLLAPCIIPSCQTIVWYSYYGRKAQSIFSGFSLHAFERSLE